MSQHIQARWLWDPDTRQYFFYDPPTDSLVFQNGSRLPRPPHVPRTSFTLGAAQAAMVPSSANYTAYTGRQNPNYVTTPPSQWYQTQAQLQTQRPAAQPSSSSARQVRQDLDRRSSNPVSDITRGIAGVSLPGSGAQPGPFQRAHNPTPIVPYVSERDGKRYVDVADTTSGVRMRYQTGPAESITDPNLYQSGVRATRFLLGTGGEEITERLFDTFRRREQPRKFFTLGKVFLILWVEPAGDSSTLVTNLEPGTSLGRFGERVYSKVRRFVVIRECDQYCSALPIASYGARGVGKTGVKKSDHSIIHTTKVPPAPIESELPTRGEQGMRPQPIRVDSDDPTDKLDPMARLDYGRIHTIHHNIKVKSFGKVNPKSMNALKYQFGNVWSSSAATTSHPESTTSRRRSDTRTSPDKLKGPRDRASTAGTYGSENSNGTDDDRRNGRQPRADVEHAKTRLLQQGYTAEEADQISRIRQAARERHKDDDDDSDDDDEDESESEPDSDYEVVTRLSGGSKRSAGSRRSAVRTPSDGASSKRFQAQNRSGTLAI